MIEVPAAGQIVRVRQRQYFVEEVVPRSPGDDAALVRMSCLDDDAQGQPLEVLWEKEVDPESITAEAWQEIAKRGFDPPKLFSAYLHTLQWNCVTSTDPNLFQSPFRAGIRIDAYQLEPLQKALRLPRVNLFIADDVGLGKTIEAGLIARELLLRKKVQDIVVCLPAVDAVPVAGRTGGPLRPGLPDPRQGIHRPSPAGTRLRGQSLDDALPIPGLPPAPDRRGIHGHAPRLARRLPPRLAADPRRSSPRCPVQRRRNMPSTRKITRAVRDLAGRFEHRLFLSATPHNGHSNSFSALLEILDPQRFCRGVPVTEEDPRRRHGAPAEGGPARDRGRISQAQVSADRHRWTAARLPRSCTLSALLDQYRELREAATAGRDQAQAGRRRPC